MYKRQVLLHHSTHTHPFLGPQPGNDIAVNAPAPEDLAAAATSYLEIRLTATDSKGLTSTVSQDLLPNKIGVIFRTEPSGLRLNVDGIPVTGPAGFTSWEGYQFTVDVPSPQAGLGKIWLFSSWSDGGAGRHTITTVSNAEYTARSTQAKCGGGVGVGVLILFGVAAVHRRRPTR